MLTKCAILLTRASTDSIVNQLTAGVEQLKSIMDAVVRLLAVRFLYYETIFFFRIE